MSMDGGMSRWRLNAFDNPRRQPLHRPDRRLILKAPSSLPGAWGKLSVNRRTAERMRDAVADVFPQLEEVEGERPKRWRLPNGLSGIFREPLADELAALRAVVRRLEGEGVKDSAALLENLATKIEASLKPARRRTLAPDIEALLEAEGFASRPGPRPVVAANICADPPGDPGGAAARLLLPFRDRRGASLLLGGALRPAVRAPGLSCRRIPVGDGAGQLPARPDDRSARERKAPARARATSISMAMRRVRSAPLYPLRDF